VLLVILYLKLTNWTGEKGTWLESIKEMRLLMAVKIPFLLRRNWEKVHTVKQKVGGQEWRLGLGPGDEHEESELMLEGR